MAADGDSQRRGQKNDVHTTTLAPLATPFQQSRSLVRQGGGGGGGGVELCIGVYGCVFVCMCVCVGEGVAKRTRESPTASQRSNHRSSHPAFPATYEHNKTILSTDTRLPMHDACTHASFALPHPPRPRLGESCIHILLPPSSTHITT